MHTIIDISYVSIKHSFYNTFFCSNGNVTISVFNIIYQETSSLYLNSRTGNKPFFSYQWWNIYRSNASLVSMGFNPPIIHVSPDFLLLYATIFSFSLYPIIMYNCYPPWTFLQNSSSMGYMNQKSMYFTIVQDINACASMYQTIELDLDVFY